MESCWQELVDEKVFKSNNPSNFPQNKIKACTEK